jgi:hypothetical protein
MTEDSDFKQVILQNLDIELHWVLIFLSQWIPFHFVQFWPFFTSESSLHHYRHVCPYKRSEYSFSYLSAEVWNIHFLLLSVSCFTEHLSVQITFIQLSSVQSFCFFTQTSLLTAFFFCRSECFFTSQLMSSYFLSIQYTVNFKQLTPVSLMSSW